MLASSSEDGPLVTTTLSEIHHSLLPLKLQHRITLQPIHKNLPRPAGADSVLVKILDHSSHSVHMHSSPSRQSGVGLQTATVIWLIQVER